MNKFALMVLALAFGGLMVAGCPKEEPAPAPTDATEDAADAAKDAAEDAGDAAKDAAEDAGDAAKDATE